MEGSMGMGFMAIFAVSGSVVLLARQVHKRLLSDFMNKIECELCGSEKFSEVKKKVRFAEDVMEPSSNNKEYRKKKQSTKAVRGEQLLKMDVENMPLNRQMLYRGIMEYNSLNSLNCF
ncbi:hypothetical protein ACOSQ4_029092 [Xanthoceras sorbifolium]